MSKSERNRIVTIIGLIAATTLISVTLIMHNRLRPVDSEDDKTGPVLNNELAIDSPVKVLSIDDLLADFDYMIETMEETFPYFRVAKRKLGIDIRALARETRQKIASYPESYAATADQIGIKSQELPTLDRHIFWSIINYDFFSRFDFFAHSMVYNYVLYERDRPAYTNQHSVFSTSSNLHAFSNPVSKDFYDEQRSLYSAFLEAPSSKGKLLFQGRSFITEALSAEPTIEIIETERIAYLKIPIFAGFSYSTLMMLRDFYAQIGSYEDLIIDIRDNTGGAIDLWRIYVMKPLWNSEKHAPDMPLFSFYKGSPLARKLGNENIIAESKFSRYFPETAELLPAERLLLQNPLPLLNDEDSRELAYGVKLGTGIERIEWRHVRGIGGLHIGEHPFNGKIWLLINGRNYSAASLFARHAKEMNFATLVGEPTGGAYASANFHIALPNAGIVLRWDIDYLADSQGKALNEFPTTPHYSVEPGEDALAFLLDMIRRR